MTNFLKEVLRCYSPPTFIPRTPIHDLTLCGTVIPAGTTVLLNPAVIHFNPRIWGPDAESFNPDRHSDAIDEWAETRDPFALEAFSNGPRICLGRAFAMLEMKSVLVGVLQRFEMERGWDEKGRRLVDGMEFEGEVGLGQEGLYAGVGLKNFVTLKPTDGVWVRFRRL
jgi:cytochrome P450